MATLRTQPAAGCHSGVRAASDAEHHRFKPQGLGRHAKTKSWTCLETAEQAMPAAMPELTQRRRNTAGALVNSRRPSSTRCIALDLQLHGLSDKEQLQVSSLQPSPNPSTNLRLNLAGAAAELVADERSPTRPSRPCRPPWTAAHRCRHRRHTGATSRRMDAATRIMRLGDLLHLSAMLTLLWRVWSSKSCAAV